MDHPRVLVIDDDEYTLEILDRALTMKEWDVVLEENGEDGLARYTASVFDVVLLDLAMPGMDGFEVLERMRAVNKEAIVIIMTGHGSTESVVKAMRAGAADYLNKPLDLDHLDIVLHKTLKNKRQGEELRLLRTQVEARGTFAGMVGVSAPMQRVYGLVQRLAASDATVLIQGETGTGKELVGQALHELGPRSKESFIAINCGALSESILESELFGHEKGAFTGAIKQKYGLIEQAQGGTLFLDEIDQMSPALQVKLLRALQEREVLRVGGAKPIAVDFRLVAATNADLRERMEQELFRADLFYRLSVVGVELPPLRERVGDIQLLGEYFLRRYGREKIVRILPEALARLRAHDWPGNVRELENAIEQASVLCQGDSIGVGDLPEHIVAVPSEVVSSFELPYKEARERFEKEYCEKLLVRAGGRVVEAARLAGMPRQSFYKKMQQHQITRP